MTLRDILELLNSKGWNKAKIAKEHLTFGEKKLASVLDDLGFVFSNSGQKGWSYVGDELFLDDSIYNFVSSRTQKNVKELTGTQKNVQEPLQEISATIEESLRTEKNVHEPRKERTRTQKNSDEPLRTQTFSKEEIAILKMIIQERQKNAHELHEETIYDLINTKVKKDVEATRSSFNLSNTTIERLNEFAKDNKLQKQDIVELALIQLLNRFM